LSSCLPPSPPSSSRYKDLGSIAGGSFGEVRRVHDTLLDRVLAMKVLRSTHAQDARLCARFIAEARVTANLQHPGIVAVHDWGKLEDGRLWFTMKEVRGRTLANVIDELHAASTPQGFGEASAGFTFRRLIDAFARISQAVAFAHSSGYVHRDLKPDNLMLGEFGEVLVMDWGLARRINEVEPKAEPADPQKTSATSAPLLTQIGDILGTPAYMAPEQAKGQLELVGPPSDVYALGAILYHLLRGKPPYEGQTARSVLKQVLNAPPLPLAAATRGGPSVPAELIAVCERAMRREIDERYPNADALARDVVAWIDGARRREQALGVLEKARAMQPEIASIRERVAECRARAKELLREVRPFEPVERKRPAWELEDEAARLNVTAALRETEWIQAMHGALSLDPDLSEAHAQLADYYRAQLAAADIGHFDEDAARNEELLRTHDRGRHAAFLRGEGALTLVTSPPSASVRVERFTLRDRRLVAEHVASFHQTPIERVTLFRGSYLLRITAPGRAEVRYPVLIDRGGHWDGCAPSESEPYAIELPRAGELEPDDIYIPAGWCWTGGDKDAPDSLPSHRVWIDAFVMRRFPVTNAEYLEFLNALIDLGRAEEALAACPRARLALSAAASDRLAYGRDACGRFVPPADEPGRPFQLASPVVLVDWYGAAAYARWKAETTGLPWRLPNELEREKATRGVDGRHYPWGDYPEPTFACVLDSHAGEPSRVVVDSFPFDESVYGVRGLGGNSHDWCANTWKLDGPAIDGGRLREGETTAANPDFRAVKGGAWSSSLNFCRAAARFALRPTLRRGTTGIRLVRSYSLTG
jgi:eukaryotic-like serine/threonine-protein kinase